MGDLKWMIYNGKSYSNHDLGVPLFQETFISNSYQFFGLWSFQLLSQHLQLLVQIGPQFSA